MQNTVFGRAGFVYLIDENTGEIFRFPLVRARHLADTLVNMALDMLMKALIEKDNQIVQYAKTYRILSEQIYDAIDEA
jgi:hypothetical protein